MGVANAAPREATAKLLAVELLYILGRELDQFALTERGIYLFAQVVAVVLKGASGKTRLRDRHEPVLAVGFDRLRRRLEQQFPAVQLAKNGGKHLLSVLLLEAPDLFVLVLALAGRRVTPDEHSHQEAVAPWQDLSA